MEDLKIINFCLNWESKFLFYLFLFLYISKQNSRFIFFSGAFSKVYEAVKLSTNEKVAIKIVRKLELNNQQVN